MRRTLVGLAIVTAGCSGGQPTGPIPVTPDPVIAAGPVNAYEALGSARARWESAGLDSYHYEFENDCGECDPLSASPREIVVWGDERYDPGRYSPSVEEIFVEIERALDDGQSVQVTYDEDLGYPVDVEIDMESRPVDGGTHWVVQGLVPGLPGDEVSLGVVGEAERLWNAAKPPAYEYTLTLYCDCPLQGSVVTRIEGDRVVDYDILYDESTGGSITPLPIDDMFADLAELMASPEGVVEDFVRFTGSARFHPDLGYPIWIGLDLEILRDDAVLADLPTRLVVTMTDLHPIQPEGPAGDQ